MEAYISVQKNLFDFTSSLEYTLSMRKLIAILCVQCLCLTLSATDITKTFTILPWIGEPPIVDEFGQTALPENHLVVSHVYTILNKPFGIDWLQSYVSPKTRRQFTLAYGRFLENILPCREILTSIKTPMVFPGTVKVKTIGTDGLSYTFEIIFSLNAEGGFEILALGNVPIEGSEISNGESP